MKTMKLLQLMTLGMILSACGDNAAENKDATATQAQIEEHSTAKENLVEDKFLITDNSVGYFNFDSSWEETAQNKYNYQSEQNVLICECDSVIDVGFGLAGSDVVLGEDGIENPEMLIMLSYFDKSKSETQFEDNPDVFPVPSELSDDIRWFWKNKIDHFVIYSDAFKTKEGIGVGSTLEELEKKLGNVVIKINRSVQENDWVTVAIDAYPNVQFFLNGDVFVDDNRMYEGSETATIADFKKNTKISRIYLKAETDKAH